MAVSARTRLASVFAGLLAAAALMLPAAAQDSGDVFAVTGVSVDATGETATQARDAALAEGQIKASDRLLRRFTLHEDWQALPQVDAAMAERLVAGVGVANERSSATRYLADMTVRFRPQPVKDLLRNSGVRFTATQAAPSLLLPVLDTPGVRVLFDDPNPWRNAWEQVNVTNSLVPLLLPLGDLEDFSAINAGDAINADWEGLRQIAEKYGVNQVIVAHAQAPEGSNLKVNLIRVTPGSREVIERSYQGETLEAAAKTAAQGIQDSLVSSWKAENAVAFGLSQNLRASVEFASLSEWLAIRDRLNATPIVEGVDINAVSPTGAQVSVRVAGSTESLAASLAERQVRLVDEGGYWTMTMASAPMAPAPANTLPDFETDPTADTPPAPTTEPTSAGGMPADEATADRLTRQQGGAGAP